MLLGTASPKIRMTGDRKRPKSSYSFPNVFEMKKVTRVELATMKKFCPRSVVLNSHSGRCASDRAILAPRLPRAARWESLSLSAETSANSDPEKKPSSKRQNELQKRRCAHDAM